MQKTWLDVLERDMPNKWSFPYVQGIMMAETEMYLRGDITRDAFTAFFAQVSLLWASYTEAMATIPTASESIAAAYLGARAATADPDSGPVVDGEASA